MRKTADIIQDIDAFKPFKENWSELDELIEELLESGNSENGVISLLGVLERYPEDDGDGVLWSIIHALEDINNYELELFNSLNRQPSFLGVVMIKRIENTGQERIGNILIQDFYKQLLNHPKLASTVKEYIVEFKKEK